MISANGIRSRPRVAVVVPAYNLEEYLPECLESVCGQTYTDWVCFVTDDGSADRTDEIVRSFSKRDGRIRSIRCENRGIGGARNLALSELEKDPEGFDYVAFADGDDVMAPKMLARLTDAAEELGGAMVTCGFSFFSGVYAKPEHRPEKPRIIAADEFTELVFSKGGWKGSSVSGGMVWKTLFPADAVRGVRFLNDREAVEDEHYCLCALRKAKKIAVLPERLYGYRQRPGSLIRDERFNHKLFSGRLCCLTEARAVSGRSGDVALAALLETASGLLLCGDSGAAEKIRPFADDILRLKREGLISGKVCGRCRLALGHPKLGAAYFGAKRALRRLCGKR